MIDILMHISINLRNNFINKVKQKIDDLDNDFIKEINLEIPGEDHKKNWVIQHIQQNYFPDMAVSHISDYAVINKNKLREYTLSLPERFPLRAELGKIGLRDTEGIFHPVYLIPFVIVCNTRLLPREKMPNSWRDLLKAEFKKKIIFPARKTPITKAVIAFLNEYYPREFREIYPLITFQGTPVEVLQSLGSGTFSLGIANLAFAKMMYSRGVEAIIPEEGPINLPQVITYSHQADKRLLALGDFLFSRDIQEMLARQKFIPVNPEAALPEEIKHNLADNYWAGWDYYLEMLGKANLILNT